MAAPSVDDLTARYSTELLPFLRQDDFYGSILLPSLVINQKGCRRAVVNRHATVLFKTWALSSPESALSLKRKATEVLPGLLQWALSGARSEAPINSFERRLGEALFRFCIWSGRDAEALQLAGRLGANSSMFVRRASVLLQASHPSLRGVPALTVVHPDATRLDGLLGLFSGTLPAGRSIPGESPGLAEFYFRFFAAPTGASADPGLAPVSGSGPGPIASSSWSGPIRAAFGDVASAVARRSTESYVVWAFLALGASGRLFSALQLARACRRAESLNRSSAFFHEEGLRWIGAAERYGLHRRWQPGVDTESAWRVAESQYLYGPEHGRRMAEALGISQQPSGSAPPPDSPEGFIRSCHERFEELMLQPASWLREGARLLLSHAGWDLRARALLSLAYTEDEPTRALTYLEADRRTPLVLFRATQIRRRRQVGASRAARKREANLKKMLEGSLGIPDPGA